MKMIKKIVISFSIIVLCFFLFSSIESNVKAEDVVTSEEISVLGAGVRTTGNAGIRFVGAVREYNTANIKAYGIAIAFGKAEANNDFVIGGTVNGKSVLNTTENVTLDDDNRFYVILYGIPEASYIQDVTARAYIVLNDDSIVYASTATTRNLADVVVKAHDDEVTGDLITEVYDKIDRIAITDNDYNIITENTINKYVNTLDTGKAFTLFEKEDAEMDDFIFVEGSKVFATLNDANAALVASDKLYLFNGTYSLDNAITVNTTIMGPNYGISGVNHNQEEAKVDFNMVPVACNNLIIDGIKIYDTGTYTKNNTQFAVAANTKDITIQNCYFYSLANIMRYTNVGVASTVANNIFTIKDCLIEELSQYIIFANTTYAAKLSQVNIIGNTIRGSHTGYFEGYGMIRIDAGTSVVTKVYNNNFTVNPSAENYFRCKNGSMDIRFNTFKNVSNFNHSASTNPIVYDCNLYLNASGDSLTTIPTAVATNQGVADKYICTNAEDLTATYQAFLANEQLTITFETNGGSAIDDIDIVKGLPYKLPTTNKIGYVFLGWTLTNNAEDVDYLTIADTKTFTTNTTIYAKYSNKSTNYNITNADATLINSSVPDIIVNQSFDGGKYILTNSNLTGTYEYDYGFTAFSTITEALNTCTTAGKKVFIFSGTYDETPTILSGITITTSGKENVIIKGLTSINGAISNVSINGISFKNRIVCSGTINTFTMSNCDIQSTVNTDGTIYFTDTAQNIRFESCTAAASASRFIYFAKAVTNVSFINNTFNGVYTLTSENKHSTGVCDMIRFYTSVAGKVDYIGNTFKGAAQSLTYATYVNPGTFTFKDNVFEDYNKAAIDFRVPSTTTAGSKYNYVVIHNTFKNATADWGTIRIRCTGLTSGDFTATVNYNIFESLGSYENLLERAAGTLTAYANFDKNYCDPNTTLAFDDGISTHANWYSSKSDLETAYQASIS